jgi:hypothetical protein
LGATEREEEEEEQQGEKWREGPISRSTWSLELV